MSLARHAVRLDLGRPSSRPVPAGGVIFDTVLLAFAAAYLFLSYGWALNNSHTSQAALLILAANGGMALVGLRHSIKNKYPIFCIFFVFNYLFFSIAPLQQIAIRWDPIFDQLDILVVSTALCAFMTAFGLFVATRPRNLATETRSQGFFRTSLAAYPSLNYGFLFIVIGLIALALLAYYGSGLFTTREGLRLHVGDAVDRTSGVFIRSMANPATVTGSLIAAMVAYHKNRRDWFILFAALAGVGFIINNPFVHARFRVSALMAFAILVYFGWWRVRFLIAFYIVGTLLSPIFGSVFRTTNSKLNMRSFDSFFAHVDYSGLDMFGYTIMWVRLQGLEWGSNIFGALFFFIPRIIWETKGKHVGAVIVDYIKLLKGFGTDNVSSPPPVEGFLSFGIIGAVFLSMAIVLTIDWVERRGMRAQPYSPFYFLLCLAPMLALITLRGPLQVGVAEWVLQSLTVLLVCALLVAGRRGRQIQRGPSSTK